jgi:hypothetical protein
MRVELGIAHDYKSTEQTNQNPAGLTMKEKIKTRNHGRFETDGAEVLRTLDDQEAGYATCDAIVSVLPRITPWSLQLKIRVQFETALNGLGSVAEFHVTCP